METKAPQTESESRKTVAIDWAESEWFQVWLRLARRDYQGDVNARNTLPAPELAAA